MMQIYFYADMRKQTALFYEKSNNAWIQLTLKSASSKTMIGPVAPMMMSGWADKRA